MFLGWAVKSTCHTSLTTQIWSPEPTKSWVLPWFRSVTQHSYCKMRSSRKQRISQKFPAQLDYNAKRGRNKKKPCSASTRSKEKQTPKSCSLTFLCTLCHTHTYKSFFFFKTRSLYVVSHSYPGTCYVASASTVLWLKACLNFRYFNPVYKMWLSH